MPVWQLSTWEDWCGRAQMACTEPWPQPHWTLIQCTPGPYLSCMYSMFKIFYHDPPAISKASAWVYLEVCFGTLCSFKSWFFFLQLWIPDPSSCPICFKPFAYILRSIFPSDSSNISCATCAATQHQGIEPWEVGTVFFSSIYLWWLRPESFNFWNLNQTHHRHQWFPKSLLLI